MRHRGRGGGASDPRLTLANLAGQRRSLPSVLGVPQANGKGAGGITSPFTCDVYVSLCGINDRHARLNFKNISNQREKVCQSLSYFPRSFGCFVSKGREIAVAPAGLKPAAWPPHGRAGGTKASRVTGIHIPAPGSCAVHRHAQRRHRGNSSSAAAAVPLWRKRACPRFNQAGSCLKLDSHRSVVA